MDTIREYWREERGVVIGAVIVIVAILVFLAAMISALLGAQEPQGVEPVEQDASPAVAYAGKASMNHPGTLARVTMAMGQTVLDERKKETPSVTPEAKEGSQEATSSEQDDGKEEDDLAKKIAALPEPASTEAIMGRSMTTVEKMVADFEAQGKAYPGIYATKGAETIEDWCRILLEEATAEGVRAEVIYAQSMHETAYLQFGNQVSAEQCNFGGLGATNDGAAGATFPDVRVGLRAQIQHLKAYASTESLEQDSVDERFDLVSRGSAPLVNDLGGKWAVPGTTYGPALMAIVNRVL